MELLIILQQNQITGVFPCSDGLNCILEYCKKITKHFQILIKGFVLLYNSYSLIGNEFIVFTGSKNLIVFFLERYLAKLRRLGLKTLSIIFVSEKFIFQNLLTDSCEKKLKNHIRKI